MILINIKIIISESQLRKVINEVRSNENYLDELFQNYYTTGSIKEFSFSDKNLTWLFNQMIGIVDELKKYGIQSNDFTNLGNLGFKKNGNLGYFDIGYGDYFDKSHEKISQLDIDESELHLDNNIIEKIIRKYSNGEYKLIGDQGFYGAAYDIGNGKVLKITTDRTEAINSNKLIGKKTEHLAEIYDVKTIKQYKEPYYVIVLELLRTSPALNKYYKRLNSVLLSKLNKHYDPIIIEYIGWKHPFVSKFLKSIMDNGYEYTWKKYGNEIDNYKQYNFNDISDLAEWIKDSPTNYHEIDNTPPKQINSLLKSLLH